MSLKCSVPRVTPWLGLCEGNVYFCFCISRSSLSALVLGPSCSGSPRDLFSRPAQSTAVISHQYRKQLIGDTQQLMIFDCMSSSTNFNFSIARNYLMEGLHCWLLLTRIIFWAVGITKMYIWCFRVVVLLVLIVCSSDLYTRGAQNNFTTMGIVPASSTTLQLLATTLPNESRANYSTWTLFLPQPHQCYTRHVSLTHTFIRSVCVFDLNC